MPTHIYIPTRRGVGEAWSQFSARRPYALNAPLPRRPLYLQTIEGLRPSRYLGDLPILRQSAFILESHFSTPAPRVLFCGRDLYLPLGTIRIKENKAESAHFN